ncbi:hypothetical protein LEMLEM_LOCUS6876, partial [Lemmus lemmus]
SARLHGLLTRLLPYLGNLPKFLVLLKIYVRTYLHPSCANGSSSDTMRTEGQFQK